MANAGDQAKNDTAPRQFYELTDRIRRAIVDGTPLGVEGEARQLLDLASRHTGDWNYGNALHQSHLALGMAALRRADLDEAKAHLLAAADVPGSPQLLSFGPNMTLALELLELGERDVVLAYFDACRDFWITELGQLQDWIDLVRRGEIPDFGANLRY